MEILKNPVRAFGNIDDIHHVINDALRIAEKLNGDANKAVVRRKEKTEVSRTKTNFSKRQERK